MEPTDFKIKFDSVTQSFQDKCHDKDLECSICVDAFKDVTTISLCFHRFCKECIEPIIKQGSLCPECRTPFTLGQLKHDFNTQKNVDKLWIKLTKKSGLQNAENPYAHKHVELKKIVENLQPNLQSNISSPSQNSIHQSPIIQQQNPIQIGKTAPLAGTNLEKIDTRKNFKAENRYFESIDAHDDVELIDCYVKAHISSSNGRVAITDCIVGKITGRLVIEVEKSTVTGDISGRWDVILKNCTLTGNISSTQGQVLAKESFLSNVEGRDGVTLENCTSTGNISSTHSTVSAKESFLSTVEGRDGVTLENCNASSVKCSHGTINARSRTEKNNLIEKMKARDGVEIQSITSESIIVERGSLEYDEKCFLGTVTARDGKMLIKV